MTLYPLYVLVGVVFAWASVRALLDRNHAKRWTTGAFWGLVAFVFLAGDFVPTALVGAAALALAAIAGFGGVGRAAARGDDAAARAAEAQRHGHRLFGPVLLIPLATVVLILAGTFAVSTGLSGRDLSLYSLAAACLLALAVSCRFLRKSPRSALDASTGLLDAVGWAMVLPLMLATLGFVFTEAKVGDLVAVGVGAVIPVGNAFACVAAYAIGMALFTMIMGNAFAAFPVMTAGIGLPLLVQQHGADPASMAALGMLSGYCGTLMTPMAANFNIVPAALLELSDINGVIKAQIPTAVTLLAANILLMYAIVFR